MTRFALAAVTALAVAAVAVPASLAQDPIKPPEGVTPNIVWPTADATDKKGEKKFDIAFYVETLPGAGPAACRQTNTFARGERAVWHIGAVNARTGKFVQPADLKYAYIKVPGVKNIGVTFVPHGRDPTTAVWTWTARWDIPSDYPLGAVAFQVVFKLKEWGPNKVATFTQMTQLGGSTMTIVPKR